MFIQRGRKDQFGIWIVFIKVRWSNFLISGMPAGSPSLVLLQQPFDAPPSPFCRQQPTPPFNVDFPQDPFHAEALCCVQNRSVAATTTEIPVEGFLDFKLGGLRIIPQ